MKCQVFFRFTVYKTLTMEQWSEQAISIMTPDCRRHNDVSQQTTLRWHPGWHHHVYSETTRIVHENKTPGLYAQFQFSDCLHVTTQSTHKVACRSVRTQCSKFMCY